MMMVMMVLMVMVMMILEMMMMDTSTIFAICLTVLVEIVERLGFIK